MVFAGLYPVDRRRLRGSARRARQAAAERRLLHLRAGELGRARLRLPLRLPRPAPHGDHPGAAGARVQPRPDHDRPRRALPRPHHATARSPGDRQPPEAPRPRATSAFLEEPFISATILTRSEYVGAILQLAEERRGEQRELAVPDHRPRADRLRLPAGRGDLRLLRPAEVGLARLRLDGLRAHRLPAQRPGQARHPGQRRAGRRAVAHRPPRQRLRARQAAGREAEGADPAPAVRGRHPGRDRPRVIAREIGPRRSARTSPPSATAATSRASASCSRSRRKARSG